MTETTKAEYNSAILSANNAMCASFDIISLALWSGCTSNHYLKYIYNENIRTLNLGYQVSSFN